VFYSDNGGNMYVQRDGYPVTSNAPLRGGKASIYEGGSRIPAAIIWPGQIKPGSSTDALVSSTDWYPTLLEMAAVAPPVGVDFDGVSQVPVLLGKEAPRKRLLNHFPHYFQVVPNEPAAYLIEGDWKLIRYYCKSDEQQDTFELYNLNEDRAESRDLATQHPERLDQMKQQMAADLIHFEADIPVANPDYDPDAPKPGLFKE
jgi:arylsulfatase A-like enzyme